MFEVGDRVRRSKLWLVNFDLVSPALRDAEGSVNEVYASFASVVWDTGELGTYKFDHLVKL